MADLTFGRRARRRTSPFTMFMMRFGVITMALAGVALASG